MSSRHTMPEPGFIDSCTPASPPSSSPSASAHRLDEWSLDWRSPFSTHAYEPIYLANGSFGGLLDLSGSTIDLWSSQIGGANLADAHSDVLWPVTALRTRAFYRNAHYRGADVWVGSAGIISADPRYEASEGIPHIPQIYDCHQRLDLRAGLATTSGQLFLGTQAALEAKLTPERAIAFETRVVFQRFAPARPRTHGGARHRYSLRARTSA